MDISNTYVKMRLTAIPDLGKGTIPGGFFRGEITKEVWVDARGNFYVQDGSRICQLERQDQLQEMVYTDKVRERYQVPKSRWLVLALDRFYDSHESPHIWSSEARAKLPPNYTLQFESMEQLWIAFVQKELHNKAWNGEEWG